MKKISSKYAEFFVKNCRNRYLIMCGGRRSGKTYSTFAYLYSIAILSKIKIVVLTFSYTTLKATMEDFTNSLNLQVVARKTGYECQLGNGSIFQFVNCDKSTKALGTQCDILFINESCNLPVEVFDTFNLGARYQVIMNYNPTSTAWSDKLISIDSENFIRTTWRDNEYITEAQRESFEELKRRFETPNHSILDEYNYFVYYKGEQCKATGMVYPKLKIISDLEYRTIPSDEYVGLDFGFSVDGDETAMVGCKIYDDEIYYKEYIYEKGLIDNDELAKKIYNNIGTKVVYVDTGGQGNMRAKTMIVENNSNFASAIKKDILNNINDIVSFRCVNVCGDNLYNEMSTTELDAQTGKLKCPKGDHASDAGRYAFNVARLNIL